MKSLVAALSVIAIVSAASAADRTSSEDDDWAEDMVLTVRECKKCSKAEIFEKLTKITDEYLKDVKPGTLDPAAAERDVADVANMLGKDDPISGAEFKEFIKSLGSRYDDKFKTTKKP